jgi:hypothetical protein
MRWFISNGRLPDPNSEKTTEAAKRVEAANKSVETVMPEPSTSTKVARGTYRAYTPEQRYQLGKYAAENTNKGALQLAKTQFELTLNESTIRGFKDAYLKELIK